jgi:hypothetical protein
VFLKLGKIVEKYKYYVREKRTSAYGQPTLVSSSMSAALKPVFERKFNYGEDRIEKYVPKSIGYCVIAQVQLKVDTNESYSFQTDMNSFDRFISDLLALQAEMRELETISKNKLL